MIRLCIPSVVSQSPGVFFMKQRGYPDQPPLSTASQHPETPVRGNLAVQASLMQIFDEFTEVISGELKSMNLDDLDAGRRKPKR
jgi:hypothetical protein